MKPRRRVAIFGATGSIGTNAIRVIRAHSDQLELIAIAGGSRVEPLAEIAREFKLKHVSVFDPGNQTEKELKDQFPGDTSITTGLEGLIHTATLEEVDMVLIAVVGITALQACIEAIKHRKKIALASKEILVMAGEFIMPLVEKYDGLLLPTDSEHNAIFQCLSGNSTKHVRNIILTASGGRYRNTPMEQLAVITPEEAVKHPNWNMGQKISIDSSTMANKGLEVIEAKWLFGMKPAQIEVVIHPQSIIHSMVQYVDGSVVAQMSPPNMSFAIQHCLLYPDRAPGVDPTIDFAKPFSLDFEAPDFTRFPCLRLAFDVLKMGHTAPAIYNAANEIAVQAFIENRISFLDIPKVIEFTLESLSITPPSSIQDIIDADLEARERSLKKTLK
ncbi:MAG: 1-deoxy-D-xylulose-5-phosphate reductoisomerase [Opitutales bacterium]|nr:1-deoxy-D-xylulose-5-phosphate reductoisomerase [Opitutales bacterium]